MNRNHTTRYLEIGLKISYYRKLSGLSQEELAEKVNLSSAYIGHLEAPNIVKGISLDALFDIADVLGVAPYKFLQFELDWVNGTYIWNILWGKLMMDEFEIEYEFDADICLSE